MKPSRHDIYLEHDNKKVAVVTTYNSHAFKDNAWFLKLNNVYPCDGVSKKKLLSLENIRLVVLRPQGDIIYDECYFQAYCGDQANHLGFEALWLNAYERNEVNVQ